MVNIVLFISSVSSVYGIGKIIHDMVMKKRWSQIKNSIEFKILIISVVVVGACFVPWNKFHYGDVSPKIIYVDTSKSKVQKPQVKGVAKTSNDTAKPPTLFVPKHKKTIKPILAIVAKADTPIVKPTPPIATQTAKNIFNGGSGQYNAPVQVGDTYVNADKLLGDDYLQAIGDYVNNLIVQKKFKNSVSVYTESTCNYPKITQQIISYLKSRGINASEAFEMGRTTKGVKVDTMHRFSFQEREIRVHVGQF